MVQSTASRDAQFYRELGQLNRDLAEYLNDCQTKSAYFDYTRTLADYIDQLRSLQQKFPAPTTPGTAVEHAPVAAVAAAPAAPTAAGAAAATTTTTTTTTASATITTTGTTANNATPAAVAPATPAAPIQSLSHFGASLSQQSPFGPLIVTPAPAAASPAPAPATPAPTSAIPSAMPAAPGATQSSPFVFGGFSFNLAAKPALATPGSAASPFGTALLNPVSTPSFLLNTNNLTSTATPTNPEGEQNDDDDDDQPPPEAKLDKYEEPDALLAVKCKLYGNAKTPGAPEATVSLLGVGEFYIKSLDGSTNKLQVVFRQDPDLRRVLLNKVVSPNLPFKVQDKTVRLCWPGDNPGEKCVYLLKLRDNAEARRVYEQLTKKA